MKMLLFLLVSRGVSGCQEAFFSFHLTPFQTQDISMRRYVFCHWSDMYVVDRLLQALCVFIVTKFERCWKN